MRVGLDARHVARGLGISTFVVELARELAAIGVVDLIWLGDPAFAPGHGVVSIARPDRLPYPILDSPLGIALAKRLRVDVLHFTGNTGWGKRAAIPSVLTLHDLIFLGSGARGRRLRQIVGHRYERTVVRRALGAATIVAVPSRTVATQVTARFDAAVRPHVVHHGVRQPPSLPTPEGPPYIVAFAGRDPRKRTDAAVEGWRAAGVPELKLRLLASGGMPVDLRERLASDLETGAIAIEEQLPRERLLSTIAGARALLYPSSDEGFGLPVLEAMAAGTPVLAGLAPVTREVGADAVIGLDERDIPGSIAAGVRRLLTDRAYTEEIRERGRSRARSFTWRAAALQYLALYHAAAERR